MFIISRIQKKKGSTKVFAADNKHHSNEPKSPFYKRKALAIVKIRHGYKQEGYNIASFNQLFIYTTFISFTDFLFFNYLTNFVIETRIISESTRTLSQLRRDYVGKEITENNPTFNKDHLLIVNSIRINNDEISIGVTDKKRWEDEVATGLNGGHAFTFLYVVIEKQKKELKKIWLGWHVNQTQQELETCFKDNNRKIQETDIGLESAINSSSVLLQSAIYIINNSLSLEQSDDFFYGKTLAEIKINFKFN